MSLRHRCVLPLTLATAACTTTVYIADPAALQASARGRVVPDSVQVASLLQATPQTLERMARTRRVTGDILTTMAQRSSAILTARYGLQPAGPQSGPLLSIVDRRSGPIELDVRTIGEVSERVEGSLTILGVMLAMRYRDFGGREVSRRLSLDIYCLERQGALEVVELVPTMTELARR